MQRHQCEFHSRWDEAVSNWHVPEGIVQNNVFHDRLSDADQMLRIDSRQRGWWLVRLGSLEPLFCDLWGRYSDQIPHVYKPTTIKWRKQLCWRSVGTTDMQPDPMLVTTDVPKDSSRDKSIMMKTKQHFKLRYYHCLNNFHTTKKLK